MKSLKNISTCFLLFLILSTAFTSCSDEGNAPEMISAKDVEGNYVGKMRSESTLAQIGSIRELTGVEVKVQIHEKEVVFDQFPVNDLITSVVGEVQAPGVIEALGDVSYKLPYTAVLNKGYTEIHLSFAPKPLELEVTLPSAGDATKAIIGDGEKPQQLKIVVTVSALDKGVFAYQGKSLNFGLKMDEVTVNGVKVPYRPLLYFSMAKVK